MISLAITYCVSCFWRLVAGGRVEGTLTCTFQSVSHMMGMGILRGLIIIPLIVSHSFGGWLRVVE
jgi:vacuolar-type H+-ATPase subunit I/STV1